MPGYIFLKNNLRAAFCGALMLFGMAMYASTYAERYQTGFAASDPNAMLLPRFLLGLLIILAGLAAIQDLAKRDAGARQKVSPSTLLLCIALLAATLAMPYTGFALSVTPLIAVVTYALGERRWYAIGGTAALAGLGFWFLFHHLLLIRLPSVISGGAF